MAWRQCDVTDPRAVDRAVRDADGVCYLVHSLSRRGFADLDRVGAAHVRDAASTSGVRRIIPKGVMGEPVDHVEFNFDVT